MLRRELKTQNLKGSELAAMLDEHKQTISAILNRRRDINPKLSIKLAKRFHFDDDYFMLLQAGYDVNMTAMSEPKNTPDPSKIRSVIFWDTSMDKIDWAKNKKAIIQRVLERANTSEIKEIIAFYGKTTILNEIKTIKKSRLPSFERNRMEHELM